MADEVFVLGLATFFALLFRWAFKTLPKEKWQIMATIPVAREGAHKWRGQNLTYYGLFISVAVVTAVSLMFILMTAIRAPTAATLVIVGLALAICFPSAKLVARSVEKKPHTLTIGGASFVGALAVPAILWFVDIAFGGANHVPIIPALASMSIAYGLGEGLGRLACISFGCCYGKPLSECRPWVRRLLGRHPFVFSGKTKKIAYESGLNGTEVVPIQAITAVLHIVVGLAAIYLYLKSFYSTALILMVIVTQAWRAVSEILRADYRGGSKVSAYQIMSLLTIAYVFLLLGVSATQHPPTADLGIGIASLWDPTVILFLQAFGLVAFLFSGRSMVTGSTMSFHVVKERI